ncbi:Type 1 glutamine amidotransferase-like domain-containing protein [Bacillus sp. 1P06AnD]
MIGQWKENGLDLILREAYENGIVLAGLSAGSMCWFEEGLHDAVDGVFEAIACLGFISGSHCPHYGNDELYSEAYRTAVGNSSLKGGVAAANGVALHYVDSKLAQIVSSSSGAQACSIHARNGEWIEIPLNVKCLELD